MKTLIITKKQAKAIINLPIRNNIKISVANANRILGQPKGK